MITKEMICKDTVFTLSSDPAIIDRISTIQDETTLCDAPLQQFSVDMICNENELKMSLDELSATWLTPAIKCLRDRIRVIDLGCPSRKLVFITPPNIHGMSCSRYRANGISARVSEISDVFRSPNSTLFQISVLMAGVAVPESE